MADAVQPMPDIRSRGMELFYVQLVFLVVSGVFVLTRAYVKIFMVKKVTLDDHLIFLAMVRLSYLNSYPSSDVYV